MAQKRSAARHSSYKHGKAASVLKLSKQAKREVAKLLRRNKAGTITVRQLKAGLKEVNEDLRRTVGMIRHLL